jgi:hypothetical protein
VASSWRLSVFKLCAARTIGTTRLELAEAQAASSLLARAMHRRHEHPQIRALGIGERYEFWLKELVRINEEEAALAGKPPLPLWDFSDPNTITTRARSRGGRPRADAMVLGALALSQGHRRPRPRSRPGLQRAGAAAAGGFRGSASAVPARREITSTRSATMKAE